MIYRFLNFELDDSLKQLRQAGEPCAIEPQVFDLLLYLVENCDRLVSHDELIEHVWRGRIVADATIASRIRAVRSVLGDTGLDQRVVQTQPKRGFRFVAELVTPGVLSNDKMTIAHARTSGADKPSIAVLPFENLSDDAEQGYFADGMTEDVINALSKFRWLFVIARGTMLSYKGKRLGAGDVARELGVRYVVEGSVRQAGGRIRVSPQLVDTETGRQLWTERFDRQLEDIFAIQDEVTNAIATAIAPEIDIAERQRAKRTENVDIDAWLLYQKGLISFALSSPEGLTKSIELFDLAFERDPDFAIALSMAALARTLLGQNNYSDNIEELLQLAVDQSERARRIDEKEAIVFWVCARVSIAIGKHSEAVEMAERALALNPNFVSAYAALALAHNRMGAPELGIRYIDDAIARSPFDTNLTMLISVKVGSLYRLKRWQEAINLGRQVIDGPGFLNAWVRSIVAIAEHKLGQRQASQDAIAAVYAHIPTFNISTVRKAFARDDPQWVEKFIDDLRKIGLPEF